MVRAATPPTVPAQAPVHCPDPGTPIVGLYGSYQDWTRPADGTGIHPTNPSWGITNTPFSRLTQPAYGDGIGTPSDFTAVNPRVVSNLVVAQGDVDLPNTAGLSALVPFYGQFLVHDTDLQAENPREILFPEGFLAPMKRALAAPGTGITTPREPFNTVTALIDGSTVYGSTQALQDELRSFEGGRLKTSAGNLLPTVAAPPVNQVGSGTLFLAGDERVNENPALASLHTLFMREHNRQADLLAEAHPEWTDQQLFNAARVRLEALIQHITYDEWLPMLLGEDWLAPYQGFDPSVDPQLPVEAVAAALRFGHTLIPSLLPLVREDGAAAGQSLLVRDLFFNTTPLLNGQMDDLLRGVVSQRAQEVDAKVVDDLRLALDLAPDLNNIDLPAINMLRGRDMGLDSYTAVRAQLGLPPVTSFADITSDAAVQAALQAAYGSVDQIDLWVGGLAEDPAPGSSSQFGITFHTIIAATFTALRDGDPLWYEGRLDDATLAEIKAMTMSDVIRANTGIEYLQANVFEAALRIIGGRGNDSVVGTSGVDLLIGLAGNDVLVGDRGNDTGFGGHGADQLIGGLGNDTLSGEDGDDQIWAGLGNDDLCGGAGRDRLGGAEGDDRIDGGSGRDELFGDAGLDWLDGGAGNDRLIGGLDNDTLVGGAGNDVIFAGEGNDTVTGGTGNDELYGGGGADRFVFATGDGRDRVIDFRVAEGDQLDLSGAGLTGQTLATLIAAGVIAPLSDARPWEGTLVTLGDAQLVLEWVRPDSLNDALLIL